MPSPTSAPATLRPDLGGSFQEFDLMTQQQGLIAYRVFPVFESAKQSGTFGKIPVEELLQNPETKRAPGTPYNRVNWNFVDVSFATVEHGIELPVDHREAGMYSDFFDAELVSAEMAREIIVSAAEQRVADAVFNATTFASNTTAVTNEWSNAASATPIADVMAGRNNILAKSGLWANVAIMNRKVFNNLKNTDEIVNRLKYAGFDNPMNVGEAAVAQVMDLDELIVAGASKNTANEGAAASLSQIWSDEYCMLARVARTNNIKEPAIGRTIHWGEDGSTIGGLVESYEETKARSTIVRVRHDVDEKMLYVDAGWLLSNITA